MLSAVIEVEQFGKKRTVLPTARVLEAWEPANGTMASPLKQTNEVYDRHLIMHMKMYINVQEENTELLCFNPFDVHW